MHFMRNAEYDNEYCIASCITLIFDDTASSKCLGRQERFRSPMPLFKESSAVHREGSCSLPCFSSGAISFLSDTAEKGPAVSTVSLQQSPMLLFRCRLMLQQRKVDPGVLPKHNVDSPSQAQIQECCLSTM